MFIFIAIQVSLASLIIYGIPKLPSAELDRKTLAIFLIALPVWVIYSIQKMPRHLIGWRRKLPFISFLGFGLSLLIFVLLLVVLTFVAAVTGLDISKIYFYTVIPLYSLSLFIALIFQSKEISRLATFGLDYGERIESRVTEDDITTQGMGETLAMLNLLDLSPDLKMMDLKKRYKELVKLYHPDRLSQMTDEDKLVAEKEFKRFKRAYELVKKQIEDGKL